MDKKWGSGANDDLFSIIIAKLFTELEMTKHTGLLKTILIFNEVCFPNDTRHFFSCFVSVDV